MKCLNCSEQIKDTASDYEKSVMWHKSCIKRFFGTEIIPEIDLSEAKIEQLANDYISHGLTVPGVQKKLSLHLDMLSKKPRLTLVNYPTGYILKPQTEEYENLPELEFISMYMAEITGIKTVPYALIRLNSSFAYITKRIDRNISKNKVEKYAMEDFCQLSNKLTEEKYHASYERCAKIIDKYSSRSGLDLSELFMRIVFSYASGNSDMHLKNLSLIKTNGEYVLSPAYDLLPVSIILKNDLDELALTLNGKNRNLRRSDFIKFSKAIGLAEKSADNIIKKNRFYAGKVHSGMREGFYSA